MSERLRLAAEIAGESYTAGDLVAMADEYSRATHIEEQTTARECDGAVLIHALALMVEKLATMRAQEAEEARARMDEMMERQFGERMALRFEEVAREAVAPHRSGQRCLDPSMASGLRFAAEIVRGEVAP